MTTDTLRSAALYIVGSCVGVSLAVAPVSARPIGKLGVAALDTPDQKSNGILLRYKFVKGDSHVYHDAIKFSMDLTDPSGEIRPMSNTATVRYTVIAAVSNVDPSTGTATIEWTSGGFKSIPSTKPLTWNVPTHGSYTITATGSDAGSNNMDGGPFATPFMVLPDKAVVVGDSWTGATAATSPADDEKPSTYTLVATKNVDGDTVAEIRVTGAEDGEAEFDIDKGYIVGMDVRAGGSEDSPLSASRQNASGGSSLSVQFDNVKSHMSLMIDMKLADG